MKRLLAVCVLGVVFPALALGEELSLGILAWPAAGGGSGMLICPQTVSNSICYDSTNGLITFEGATANAFETSIAVTDPFADTTFTIGPSPDGNPWIGAGAGDSASATELGNVFMGQSAGTAASGTSTDNTCVGDGSCVLATTADQLTCLGADSCDVTTAGTRATAIGFNAGHSGAEHHEGVAVGADSIIHSGGGVAVGTFAETADGVSIGYQAGDAQTTSEVDNVYIGWGAGGASAGTSQENTCIGDLACDALTSGDRNVLLGANTDVGTNTDSDVTVIGESMVTPAADSILIGFGGQQYMYVHGAGTALVDATAKDIVQISVADDTMTGATIEYTVTAIEADEYQVARGSVYLAAENDSGTESCTVGEVGTSVLAGGGALALTQACTTGLANVVMWNLTADSDMGAPATTLRVYWSIRIDGPSTAVVPQ